MFILLIVLVCMLVLRLHGSLPQGDRYRVAGPFSETALSSPVPVKVLSAGPIEGTGQHLGNYSRPGEKAIY